MEQNAVTREASNYWNKIDDVNRPPVPLPLLGEKASEKSTNTTKRKEEYKSGS